METTRETVAASTNTEPSTPSSPAAGPPNGELFVEQRGATSATYLIGYEDATLASGKGGDDTRGVEFFVALGDLAPPSTAIYAENLYLRGGQTYAFAAGSALLIVAKTIQVIGSGVATLSVAGDSAPEPPWVPYPAATDSGPGKTGVDGFPKPGDDAARQRMNGGKITLYVSEFRFDEGCSLSLIADGGDGGNGQPGQNVTPGGTGGAGGAGGAGGDGGEVHVNAVQGVPPNVTLRARAGHHGTSGTGGYSDSTMSAPGFRGDTPDPYQDGQAGTLSSARCTTADLVTVTHAGQLMMMIERMDFSYLCTFTLESFSKSDSVEKQFQSLGGTWDWLNIIFGSSQSAADPRWVDARRAFELFSLKVVNRVDYYGNRFTMVPQINLDITSLDAGLRDLRAAENAYTSAMAELIDYTKNKDDIADKYQTISSKAQDDTTRVNAAIAQLADLDSELPDATAEVYRCQAALETALAALKDKIESLFSCKWQDVISALGSMIMMGGGGGGGEGEGAFSSIVGGGLTMLAAYHPETAPLGPSGAVDKTYLVHAIENVAADLQKLKEGYSVVQGVIQTDGQFSAMLAGVKADFDSLYQQYLQQLDVGVAANDAFDEYIDAVQARNALIAQYNEVYIQFQKLLLDKQKLQNQAEVISGNLDSLNDVQLQVLFNYLSSAYSGLRLALLEQLYVACRAYWALTLGQSSAMAPLAAIGTIADLDTDALQDAYTSLKNDLGAFQATLGDRTRVTDTIKAVLDANNAKRTLARLTGASPGSKPSFTYTFLPCRKDGDYPFPEFKGKANIRVQSLKVYLIGAKATDGTNRIPLSIRQNGTFTVVGPRDGSGDVPHDFDNPTLDRPWEYEYSDPKDPTTFKGTTGDPPSYEIDVTFASGDSGAITSPLVSPFAQWTVQVTKEGVDVSGVTSIVFEFQIYYVDFVRDATPPSTGLVLAGGGPSRLYRRLFIGVTAGAAYGGYRLFQGWRGVLDDDSVRQRWEKRFGDSYAEMPGKINAQFGDPVLDEIFEDGAHYQAQLDKAAPEDRGQTMYQARYDQAGHFTSVGKAVDFGAAAQERITDYALLKHCAMSLPGGSLFFEEADARAFLASEDRKKFLLDNQDRLMASSVAIYRDGKPLEGRYVLLGQAGLVKCSKHVIETRDGKVVQTGLMETTSYHPLDGNVPWSMYFDPAHPTEVVCMSVHAGEHPLPGMDTFNSLLAPALFGTMFETLPIRAGMPFDAKQEDVFAAIRAENARLSVSACILENLDRASPYGASARELAGPHTKAEQVSCKKDLFPRLAAGGECTDLIDLDVMTVEQFDDAKWPETDAEPGFYADDVAIVASSYALGIDWNHPLNDAFSPVTKDDYANVRQIVEENLKYTLSQDNEQKISDKIREAVDAKVAGQDWQSKSPSEWLHDVATPDFVDGLIQYTNSLTFDTVVDQVRDTIDADTTLSRIKDVLYESAASIYREVVTSPMLSGQGFVESTASLHILEKVNESIDIATVERNLGTAAAAVEARQSKIDSLNAERQKATDPDEIKKLEAEIEDETARLEEEQEQVDRLQEQKETHDNYSELHESYESRASSEGERLFPEGGELAAKPLNPPAWAVSPAPKMFATQREERDGVATIVAINHVARAEDRGEGVHTVRVFADHVVVPAAGVAMPGAASVVLARHVEAEAPSGSDPVSPYSVDGAAWPAQAAGLPTQSGAGIHGADGVDGQRGNAAGTVYWATLKTTGRFLISARGAQGQRGQDGQKGGTGGTGATGADAPVIEGAENAPTCSPGSFGGTGGYGGSGGKAGRAGDGGDGGQVVIVALSGETVDSVVTTLTGGLPGDTTPGVPAKGGGGGGGGSGGEGGLNSQFHQSGDHFITFSCEHNGERAPTGSTGGGGSPGQVRGAAWRGKDGWRNVVAAQAAGALHFSDPHFFASQQLSLREAVRAHAAGDTAKATEICHWLLHTTPGPAHPSARHDAHRTALHRRAFVLKRRLDRGADPFFLHASKPSRVPGALIGSELANLLALGVDFERSYFELTRRLGGLPPSGTLDFTVFWAHAKHLSDACRRIAAILEREAERVRQRSRKQLALGGHRLGDAVSRYRDAWESAARLPAYPRFDSMDAARAFSEKKHTVPSIDLASLPPLQAALARGQRAMWAAVLEWTEEAEWLRALADQLSAQITTFERRSHAIDPTSTPARTFAYSLFEDLRQLATRYAHLHGLVRGKPLERLPVGLMELSAHVKLAQT